MSRFSFIVLFTSTVAAVACDAPDDPQPGASDPDATDATSDGDDATQTSWESDGEVTCHSDYPCWGRLARCDDADPSVIVRMRDKPCWESCGTTSCTGSYCMEAERIACPDDSVCVTESLERGHEGASCRPRAETCGGPEGRSCGEGAACEYASGSNVSACDELLNDRPGFCLPIEGCDDSASPVCGCGLDEAGGLRLTTYDNDCARRQAGDALERTSPCPMP